MFMERLPLEGKLSPKVTDEVCNTIFSPILHFRQIRTDTSSAPAGHLLLKEKA